MSDRAAPVRSTHKRNTGPAHAASMRLAAERAVDDPAKLARAARVVRAAIARGVLSAADLVPDEATSDRLAGSRR